MSRFLAIVALVAIVTSGCSRSTTSDDAAAIGVTLEDIAITLSQSAFESGTVVFETENAGTLVHEIEIFKGNRTDLPVDKGVADTGGLDLLDEIEDIVPGTTVDLGIGLEPGDYVILCNLPGHYEAGMVTSLTVTD